MDAGRLAIVVLHYGDPALTERITQQLSKTDPKYAGDLFVLDNHAPQPYPHAWLRTEENLYWAGALQLCLSTFREQGYTHLWFLNNDIWFGSRAPHVERAWKRLQLLDERIGPVGVYSPSVTRNPYHPQMEQKPQLQYSLVPYVDGIAPLFSMKCLEEAGGLDIEGNPYGYGVDVWNSLVLHRAGFSVVVDHQVFLKHVYHSTAKKVDGFLTKAGAANAEYMTHRLGPDYEAQLHRELAGCRDFSSL